MTSNIIQLPINDWQVPISPTLQSQAIDALESGCLLLMPNLAFNIEDHEQHLISPEFSNKKAKNISLDSMSNRLKGANGSSEELITLQKMIVRFSDQAHFLIQKLFPDYRHALQHGRTSFRPVQITNRKVSYRKDDKRLHVDAFPSSPNQGRRILRVFSNINPHGEARIWRIGEPFEAVATRFLPKIPRPIPGSSRWLQRFKITRSPRTEYDHIMLQLHNRMKKNMDYQQQVPYTELQLWPGSTWIVQTDQVSHAALSGQHLLEQTFYLPISAMRNPQNSPLKILERLTGRILVD